MKKILSIYFLFIFSISNYSVSNNDLFNNKNILVLGGTGYLGRSIATEVLKYNPRQITIFSRDEVKHFNVSKMFGNDTRVQSVIGDIRDYNCLLNVTKGVDIVFHVAALKRMDALESNVEEAIKTNVLGSLNVFNACVAHNVDKVLFISTDKACLPINTYGACKFLSEKIFTNYDRRKISTKFMVTRFGNILESTGSVIPIFAEKIKNNEDIPLTDDRMTRFIICKEEATELIFDALRYGIGGEIFIKKLPSMRIVDLIDVLKAKFKANNNIKVIGLRPGEKIDEVLINDTEIPRSYEYKDFFVIKSSVENLFSSESELALYQKEGRRVSLELMSQYSSDQAIVSQDTLLGILDKFSLL